MTMVDGSTLLRIIFVLVDDWYQQKGYLTKYEFHILFYYFPASVRRVRLRLDLL